MLYTYFWLLQKILNVFVAFHLIFFIVKTSLIKMWSFSVQDLCLCMSDGISIEFIALLMFIAYINKSSSSCHVASTDLPDTLSQPVSIVHCSWEVFKATSCIKTKLLYIGFCWSSCLCSSMWRGPQEYHAYKFVLTFPAVFCMSGSSNLDSFRDGYSCCFVGCCLQDLFNTAFSLYV